MGKKKSQTKNDPSKNIAQRSRIQSPTGSNSSLTNVQVTDVDRKAIIDTVLQNVKGLEHGMVDPEYAGVTELLNDGTSPLFGDADLLAAAVLKVVDEPKYSEKEAEGLLDLEKAREIIANAARSTGVMLTNVYAEDLISVAYICKGITNALAYAYFRGVARCAQVSVANQLERTAGQLDAVFQKSNDVMSRSNEINKSIEQKQRSLSEKLDGVLASIVNNQNSNTEKLLAAFKNIKVEIPSATQASATQPVVKREEGQSSKAPSVKMPKPSEDDVNSLLVSLGVEESKRQNLYNAIGGKITWRDYEELISGGLSKKQTNDLFNNIRKRK
ncbi:TPA_asm: P [Carrot gammacytorhabdovirus 1]|nr:TPA_asm: P [Carrot gammacytorhabdovirus 1]